MAIRWEKLTVKSQEAMQQAQGRAAELGNPEMQPVHLLLALIGDREGVIPSVLEKIGVPTERLEQPAPDRGETASGAGASNQPGVSPALTKVLDQAFARPRTSKMNTFRRNTCCWELRMGRAMRRAMRCWLWGDARGNSQGADRGAGHAARDGPESRGEISGA